MSETPRPGPELGTVQHSIDDAKDALSHLQQVSPNALADDDEHEGANPAADRPTPPGDETGQASTPAEPAAGSAADPTPSGPQGTPGDGPSGRD